MDVIVNSIDSTISGLTFLDIADFDPETDFKLVEKKYIREFNPFYVSVKLPVEQVNNIQILESYGFNFIEFQIRETLRLRKEFDHLNFSPYKLEPVTSKSDLETVLSIAADTFRHDRYTVDPFIPKSFSGDRYKYLVRKSFECTDEFVYKFFNTNSGEILGFKTHKLIGENQALMYLGGIAEKYKRSPLPGICGYLELNELFRQGIKIITTHISGANYGVLNLEVKEYGYKVTQAFVVLRKIYK